METVRFGDGGVVFPWTYFLPGGGYTNHRYDAAKRANRCRWRFGWLRRIGRFFWYRKYSRDGFIRLRILGLRFKFAPSGAYSKYVLQMRKGKLA